VKVTFMLLCQRYRNKDIPLRCIRNKRDGICRYGGNSGSKNFADNNKIRIILQLLSVTYVPVQLHPCFRAFLKFRPCSKSVRCNCSHCIIMKTFFSYTYLEVEIFLTFWTTYSVLRAMRNLFFQTTIAKAMQTR
jgi:hypothetical protein